MPRTDRLNTPGRSRTWLPRYRLPDDAFGSFAESFARFMGTAQFIMWMTVFIVAWIVGVGLRSDLIVEVLRDRNALYREAADGAVENAYTLKLVNKSDADRDFRIAVESAAPGLELRDNGGAVHARAGAVVSVPLVVVARDGASGRAEIRFVVEGDGATREVVDSSFFGPM